MRTMTDEPTSDPLTRPCPFITFYSFKGGVGRSMALINVAGILAARGFRVLVIDMDLEAPGLSFLARRADAEGQEPPKQDGFVECLLDAKERGEEADLFARPPAEAIERFCAPYELPPNLEPREGATLHIMPAGRLDDGYAKRLEQLDLAGLYREGLGLALVMTFKEIVQTGGRFDYVFIDSRTGFSDESGICTRDLADALVVLSGLNTQNVQGTSRFFGALRRALAQRELPRPKVAVVLSPVPNGEDELVDEREAVARVAFGEAWGEALAVELRIPYHPRLALTEEPHIFRRSRGFVIDAYRGIEATLREMLGDTEEAWSKRAEVALRGDDFAAAAENLRRALPFAESMAWVDRLANRLAARVEKLAGAEARGLITLLAEIASPPAREALALALARDATKREKTTPEAAASLWEHAVVLAPDSPAVVGDYASFLSDVGRDLDAAEAHYLRALDADPRHPTILGNYANFLCEERREIDAAEAYYRRALAADPHHGNNLGNYAGFLWRERRDFEAAEDHYRRSVEANPRNPLHTGAYAAFLWQERRDLEAAETLLRSALEVDPRNANNLSNYAVFLRQGRRDLDAAEAHHLRALEADPKHVTNFGNYAIFLQLERRDLDGAEAHYRRALDIDPRHANSLGNLGGMLLATGRDVEGLELVERAIGICNERTPGALDAECAMYLVCCAPTPRRTEALVRLRALVEQHGIRTDDWDFSGVITRATETGHPDAAWLPTLAEVVGGRQPLAALDDWPAWHAAKTG